MASLATSQFIFHDDTIDILVGNRVVNNVQLTNSCILALHRIGRFDVPQVFAVYISSEEPGLHSILFRLSTIKDVATLVPLMRIDISSIMSNCPGLTVSHLFPEHTKILLYLREEHICIQFSPSCIIYANMRLSHRVDTGGVYRFVLPSTASCMLNIPNPEHITSMDANEYLYACVGNALLRTKTPINLHILSRRQTPMMFKRVATLSTSGEYVCLNCSILSDSTLSEIDTHRPGYKHAPTLLKRPIDIAPLSQKFSQQLQSAYPPLPSTLLTHKWQKEISTASHLSTNSTTFIKHYIMNISGSSQTPVFLIGTLVHDTTGCFSFFSINIYTLSQVPMSDWKRYTKNEMTSASMFRLCKTVGRINLDELCTYRFPLATETEMKPQQLGGPSLCHTKTYLDNFTISPLRAINNSFFFSMSFMARYTDTDAFRFFYAFQVNCESANIRLVMKQIYLSVPRAPDCNEFALTEQTIINNTIAGVHLVSFISDKSENLLYIHDNTKVYFLMMFNEKIKFVSGRDLTLFIYSYANNERDVFNIYNLELSENCASLPADGLEAQEHGGLFEAVSYKYVSKYSVGLAATFLRLVGFGKNLMMIQGIAGAAMPYGNKTDKLDGELIKITIFSEKDGNYLSSFKYLVLPHTSRDSSEASLKHALFTSFERYGQLYIAFCTEYAADNRVQMTGDTLKVDSLARIASTASITRTSSITTIGSDHSTESLLTIPSDLSDASVKTSSGLKNPEPLPGFPCPNIDTHLDQHTRSTFMIRDFNLLTIVFTMSGRYLYSTGFQDLEYDALPSTEKVTSDPSDDPQTSFFSSGVTQFRCLLRRSNLIPHRLFYVLPNDCLRLSFITPYELRAPLQRHKIHVERFFLPFLSIATCFLSSAPSILRTYTAHLHTTLFRRFITNVLTSSHYLFNITLRDKLEPDTIMKYAFFNLYDVSVSISEFTSILLLSTSQHYDYDSHLTNYIVTKLLMSKDLPRDRLLPYLVTGVLCLTKQLGPKGSDSISQDLAYDLPNWLETYLSADHVAVDYTLLAAHSGSVPRIFLPEAHAFKTGLLRVLPSVYLRGLFIAIGDTEYRLSKVPNSVVTFYYVITNRLVVLANLYLRAQNTKVATFLKSHTYNGEDSARSFEVARKNAFVLLTKCDYYMAAAWFVLAADFEHMVTVLVDKRYMANIDLGLAVFRYLRDTMSDSLVKLTQLSSTFVITPDHLTSMERVLFNSTIKEYVVTEDTEDTGSLSPQKHTVINLEKSEISRLSYKMSSSRIHKNITDFTSHCMAAYDIIYYYFVLSQYEDSSEFLAAVITDVVAAIISFTQHTTLENGTPADMHEAISVVLHVLHNFIFLCVHYKMTNEIRSILNALYRLYSCNMFGPIEKLRILNLSMYILALSRRTFAAVEGLGSFLLLSDVKVSQRQLFNAFELSFVSLIHLHSNTLSTSLLYNAFLYFLNPSRYLGSSYTSRMKKLREQCDIAAEKEIAATGKDESSDSQSDRFRRILSTFVFYLCLGFFTGDGKRAANLMWEKYQSEVAEHILFTQLKRRPSRFDIENAHLKEERVIRRRRLCAASVPDGYIDDNIELDNDNDESDSNNSSYSYSDDESCHEPIEADSEEEVMIKEKSHDKTRVHLKNRRCRLQTPEEIQHLCRIVHAYFKTIFGFTQSPRIIDHTTQILNSFEATILPVVNTTITAATSKEIHDMTDSLLNLISTLSTGDEASKQLLNSVHSEARVLQSESEYQSMATSDRDSTSIIQQLLFKRRENPTSASSDRELLKQPKHREKRVITISDMEMHTTMLSDAMNGPYDTPGEDDYDRTARTPFAKHPVLRRSLGFVIVTKNNTLMIEQYDTLLEFYSYLTLTPGGYTRYVPAAFNSALAATAHSISLSRKEASTMGFEMLSVFLTHGSNSLSHLVRHGLSATKRVEPMNFDCFLATHAQNSISDVRISNLFYILIALHEYTINNGSMLLFRNTMQSKYGLQIHLNQLMEKTSNCPYKDILPAYHAIFKEIQRNALTTDEVSYLEILEHAGTTFVERLLIAKKLILLEIYYIISRYKTVPTKESRIHHMRAAQDSGGGALIPSTLITFLKNPFVCFLNGLLNHIFYSPRLALNATPISVLHKTQISGSLAEDLLPVLKDTLFWQTYIAKDWKTSYAASERFFDSRLLRYCIFLSKYILLYLYPSSILVFSIVQNNNPSSTTTVDGTMVSIDTFEEYGATDESDSGTSLDGSSDVPPRLARRGRLKSRGRKDHQTRRMYDLRLVLEYTNVTSFIQTSKNTFYLLVKSNYIIGVTLHKDGDEVATVSAPISTNFDSEKLIGGLDTINDLGVLFSKSMYSVFCKDGIVVPAVQNRNIKFGLTDASLSLKTATIHDMALFTNFQALALVSYLEHGSSDNTPPKLILATVNLLNCSIIDGIELEEAYVHIVLTKVRDIQILLLFGAKEYCILCKHVAGATDTYIKAEGGLLPEDVGSALVLAEALCEGSRVIYRLVYAVGRGAVKTHVITYHVNVV
ncbi:hypothetical protein GL50803_0093550 [Giardia duodenalis]|uniref:Uncharacterized protein n=1 Tax=Giardia intestinalis (strain ATCC 50803 / WB clone C6) TaxID=184922 RepID=A8BTG5_GIAIC|nr:hypothetical protein GL50803_0093550 [Giardia intestinalis]KAE8304425.1 hypothetical protein GL50803_0093550 [Giardia intestinalis]|eukprot:XP_001704876.1 Hypothetical protein GL50803_93550 [Giardia lamblia ATCC 50803]